MREVGNIEGLGGESRSSDVFALLRWSLRRWDLSLDGNNSAKLLRVFIIVKLTESKFPFQNRQQHNILKWTLGPMEWWWCNANQQ